MIKRLIFDVDGTLITNVSFQNSIKRILEKYNKYSKQNIYKFYEFIKEYEEHNTSYNRTLYIKELNKKLNIQLEEKFLDDYIEELKNAICKPTPKLIDTLEKLQDKYELVILTNYFSVSQKNRLEKMNLNKYFKEYHGEKTIKPYKESYEDACGPHKKEECLMIGDDINKDIYGALNNGLKVLFINNRGIEVTSNIKSIDKVENITIDLIEQIDKM